MSDQGGGTGGPDEDGGAAGDPVGLRRDVVKFLRAAADRLARGEDDAADARRFLEALERAFPFEARAGDRYWWRTMAAAGSAEGRKWLATWMWEKAAELEQDVGGGPGIGPDGV